MSFIRNMDCAEGLAEIPDGSIDVIFTDPPYVKVQWEAAYRILADHAPRVLKPSGFLATYAGQYHLPEVMRMLDGDVLGWFWIVGQLHTGMASPIWPKNVISSWKPILIFQKDPATPAPKQLGDLVGGKWRLKKHPWEQALSNTLHVLSRLAGPGARVCDPFCGTGTNLLAAKVLSMEWCGFEVNAETHALAVSRLEQESLAGRAIAEVSA